MDALLLDAAPLAVLSATGLAAPAASFGFRWLLARLYLGAGAVKLLSCDASWRDLSAVHWHLQSQPLPNPFGALAFHSLPTALTDAATLGVLVIEMAAPFFFLAPSLAVRRAAFSLHVLLMAAIAVFGNFGPLQALLVVVGFALLDGEEGEEGGQEDKGVRDQQGRTGSTADAAANGLAWLLGVAAAAWALHDVSATCEGTWAAAPLVYGLLALASASIAADSIAGRMRGGDTATAAVVLAGSAGVLASGLDAPLPLSSVLLSLNVGASPYGLFAIMTGVGGRPVTLIEAANTMDGPWVAVPLRYQVNDPAASLPWCFPHFPRMDWSLWFVPLGDPGRWLAQLLRGLLSGDPAILSLVDERAFRAAFAEEGSFPPAYMRLSDLTYSLDPASGHWLPHAERTYVETISRSDLGVAYAAAALPSSSTWPSLLPVRLLAESLTPEQFIWASFVMAELARQARVEEGKADQKLSPGQDTREQATKRNKADGGALQSVLSKDIPEVVAIIRGRGKARR